MRICEYDFLWVVHSTAVVAVGALRNTCILRSGRPDVLLLRHPEPLAGRNHAGRRLLQEHQRRHQSPAQKVNIKMLVASEPEAISNL